MKDWLSGRHLVLIGLPGAGKTSIGRLLSEATGYPFLDIDEEVERSIGKSIPEIFENDGEQVFRQYEADTSYYIVKHHPSSVISAGGGWATNKNAVAHLRSVCRIIYLRVDPVEAYRRVRGSDVTRPLLAQSNGVERMKQLYNARRAQYEELADVIVDADTSSQRELVNTIIRQISND